MANTSRILLCGDVAGSFQLLGKLLKQIQDRQGPFAALFCCGTFFGEEASSGKGDESGVKATGIACPSAAKAEPGESAGSGNALLGLLQERYPSRVTELLRVSTAFPIPVFFIDQDVASLVIGAAAARRQTPRSGSGEAKKERMGAERGTDASTEQGGGTEGLDGQNDAARATHADGGSSSLGACSQAALFSALAVDLSGASAPVQVCHNVFWLGAAGVSRVAGLKVAFFGMPESDSTDAPEGGEGDAQQGESEAAPADERLSKAAEDTPAEARGSPSAKRRRVEDGAADACVEEASSNQTSAAQSHSASSGSSSRAAAPQWLAVFRSSAKALRHGCALGERPEWKARIDILLTTRWPEGMCRELSLLVEQHKLEKEDEFNSLLRKQNMTLSDLEMKHSAPSPARLAAFLEPRYLFAASAGIFYQRPAFRGTRFGYTVKFIALGVLGSKRPETKPLHALQLTPLDQVRAALSPSLARVDAARDPEAAAMQAADPLPLPDEAASTLFALPPDATRNPFSRLLPPELQLPARLSQVPAALESVAPAILTHELLRAAGCSEGNGGHAVPPHPPLEPNGGRAFGPRRDSQPRGQRGPQRPCCVVCVCNLPYEVDDESLERVMGAFGEVKFVYAPRNPEDKSKGTGKAFVVYFAPESAEKAVEASGQLEAGRRVLRVAMWREKIPFAHKQLREDGAPPPPQAGSSIVTKPHADCWFCLANPKVEKHLVAAVGETCYVAAPKGGLHPLHALIIPITHFPSVAFATEEVRAEVGRYVDAFRTALRKKENLDCIVYERYVPMRTTKAMHTQVQCVPCSRAEGFRAVEFFKKKAHKAGLRFEELPHDRNALPFSDLAARAPGTESAYFYIELPGLSTASGMLVERFLYVQPNATGGDSRAKTRGSSGGDRLPMNFGREIVAQLIEHPELADWQNCIVDAVEERSRAMQLTKLLG
ncbi:RNA recognition motif-containing protein [Besnoitia besnoiti]|uniref:RNA recognition motif-containing protein n=1 Tax=Besnoitia besnoiti TaxID=94643 RepID=A0A2A9M4K8_BESBE|nr:RNA recognition motif-containing protein [Besnoitia besnoiti]PFH32154.1 RNA recognition motif-containing protein [Besnoitia besnoiti]